MLSDDQIARYNPWWTAAGWEERDAHLRRLGEREVHLPAPQVESIPLGDPGIHMLRGPRQVGKSTDLKLLIRRALDEGLERRQIAYLSLDLLEHQPAQALIQTLERTLEIAAGAAPGRLILLDEVTSAPDWRTALKVMWDDGRIDRDVVVCTGSSAVELARGTAERLPGRRGAGRDLLILPQSFASFARAIDPDLPESPQFGIRELLEPDGRELLSLARVHQPSLQRALERYLLFGGLPAAVSEAVAGNRTPSEQTRSVLWDSVVKEVQRKGASFPAIQALFERVMRSLGSRVSWSRMAREMDVSLGSRGATRPGKTSPRTLQDYIEFLALGYFALIVHFWRPDSGGGDMTRGRKVYFGDPLLHTITADRLGLHRNPHADVENAVALALYRRYEPEDHLPEGTIAPQRLHVWATSKGGEIDFVCGPRNQIEAVEVADQEHLNRQKATAPGRALPGRPSLVATRSELDFGPTANLVPTALLLWALG